MTKITDTPQNKMLHYNNYATSQSTKGAATLIRIVVVCIGLMVLVMSRYAFVLFTAAMLPSLVTVFVDRTHHKCGSATICSFNLIGTLPYLIRLWHSSDLTQAVHLTISDIRTWLIIYGVTLVGQIMYWGLPLIVSRLYVIKSKVQATILRAERDKICANWGVKSDDPYAHLSETAYHKMSERSLTQLPR